jgi:hypothetical protein
MDEPVLDRGRRPGLEHSPGYASVNFRGRSYSVNKGQRRALEVLDEAWIYRRPPVSWQVLKEFAAPSAKGLSAVFRGSELWKTLVISAGARDTYTLNLP